jgi:predicted nuclease with TOPRIM domain
MEANQMTIEELKSENARLKEEIKMLEGRVRYWKIEAECDHGRWIRTLEDLEHLRNLK